ncbi:MAG: MarR family transcriptional regulator [Clostridiales bacterium]|jgi:DNA-binding MarR family transcriptional regulator|nr:MarR family transcriptional regulator [Clostridiales bacterium]
MEEQRDIHELSRRINSLLNKLERQRRLFMSKALEGTGLHGIMHRIILILEKNPGSSQEFIAERLSLEKGNNARLARELEDMGLLFRTMDESNRRQYKIFLTDKGRELVPDIRKALSEWNEMINEGLESKEQEALAGLLLKMLENVEEHKG